MTKPEVEVIKSGVQTVGLTSQTVTIVINGRTAIDRMPYDQWQLMVEQIGNVHAMRPDTKDIYLELIDNTLPVETGNA